MALARARRVFGLLTLLALASPFGCTPGERRIVITGGPTKRPVPRDPKIGDYANDIASKDVWDALAATPGTQHVARSEVVKTIFDRTDGKLYFLESRVWPLHYDFAKRFLVKKDAPIADQTVFNQAEYRSEDRRFVLGTLTHYVDTDRYTFDLFASDTLSVEKLVSVFEAIRAHVFFEKELAYRPVPPSHEQAVDRLRQSMPILTTAEIFAGIRYQPLEIGDAYGTLRIVKRGEKLDRTTLRPWDIVVLAEQPEDIPVVSGVVTDEIQAPLGHINVLCHNRQTPNMALREASTNPDFIALAGQLVRLSVGEQSFQISRATREEVDRALESKRPKKGFTPIRDDRFLGLPSLDELTKDDIRFVGAKTAQLAVVRSLLPKEKVPKGFAVPFAAYARFLKENGFDQRIHAMLGDRTFREDPAVRVRELDRLRDDMSRGKVAEEIVSGVVHRAEQMLPKGKIRLRSSTNAEDLPGFNGAGLYRSVRVDAPVAADIARGLREVWASTWLSAAYEEREFYRINHETVGMAVLVQESVDDNIGTGVAITANPFSQGNPGFFLNTQANGGSVTGAKGNEIPEQILYYTYDGGRGFERMSRSSLNGGKNILEDAVVEELVRDLRKIHDAFTGDPFGASGKAVDVEYIVRNSVPHIVIVQARPYAVVWPEARKWRDENGKLVVP